MLFEQQVPNARRFVVGDEKFETILAGIAGTRGSLP